MFYFFFDGRKKSKIAPKPRLIFYLHFSGLPYGDDNNDIYSNDDYEDGNDSGRSGSESVIHTIPQFVSESQSDLVNEGSTIRLPCLVDRLGKKRAIS